MKYIEQINNEIKEYEKTHYCRPDVVGMTPSMYDLLKNEIGVDVEPKGGWRTVYGIRIDVQEVADVPLFWFNGSIIIHRPNKPIDPASVQKALEIHISGIRACRSDGCPYVDEYPAKCVMHLCKDALEVIKELRGNKT